MTPYLQGQIVDLGCGPAVMYEGKQVSLIGIDWSSEALLQARKHYPQGVYIQADVTKTGLPQGQFDTVVMCGLLDYFGDWKPVIDEAKRLVKPEGKIFATLLYGFNKHMWTEDLAKTKANVVKFKHITGNWYLIEIK